MTSDASATKAHAPGSRTYGRDEFIGHCAAILEHQLGGIHGLRGPTLARLVEAIILELRLTFGGTTQYIPRGRVCPDERAAELWARKRAGESVADLAQAYGYTQARVIQQIQRENRRLAAVRKKADASAARQRKAQHGSK